MSGFVVDSRSLLAVRATLGRLHDQLVGIPNVVSGYDGVLGGRVLEAELEQFCSRWHYGIIQIAGRIDGMMERLQAAAAAYERIDHRIASGTHKHHPGVGSGTTSVGGGPPPGSGSGTTTIGGGPSRGSGSGTTVIG